MRGPRPRWPLLALAAAAILPVHEAVLGGRVLFYRDIHLAWHPAIEGFVRAVAEGAWPLWDPAPAFGQPLLADPQWMIAYPPTWLNLVIPPWAYYTLFALAHLFWSALGTYRLSRRWRCSPPAATLAGVVWCLSGPMASLVSLYHHFASACWMPWVFLTAERALLTRRRRDVAVCGATMAAQVLAGSADMTAMTWLAFAAYAGARLVRWRRPLARRNRALVTAGAGAVLLAVLIGAIVWMPALELVRRSARSALPDNVRTYWSLHPLALLEACLPGLFRLRGLRPELAAELFEGREPFLQSSYLGIAAVPLVAAAFAGRRPRRHVLGALAVGSVAVALGRHFVAYSAATTLLPPLTVFRYPVKAYVLFAWAWALLCGQGLEAWRRARGSRRAWTAPAAAAAAVTALTAAVAAWLLSNPAAAAARLLKEPSEAVIAGKAWALLAAAALSAAAAGLAIAGRKSPGAGPRLAAAAAVLAAGDLAVHGHGLNPTASRRLYARPPAVDVLRAHGAQRIHSYGYMFGSGPRQIRYARLPAVSAAPEGWTAAAAAALAQQMALVPNTPSRWGLALSYEGDATGLHSRELSQVNALHTLVDGTPAHVALLRLGGVTHLLSLDAVPGLALVSSLPVLLESPLRIYEVPQPLPRAYTVGAAREMVHVGELVEAGFDPRGEVLIGSGAPPFRGAPGPAGRVEIEEQRADRLRLRAHMDREGYVVVLENHDPGWLVSVDGERRPLLLANGTFRAVSLPAGTHHVEMRYRPRGAVLGAVLALVGVAAAIVLFSGRRPAPDG